MRDTVMYIAVVETAKVVKRKLRKTDMVSKVLAAYYPRQTVEEIAGILMKGYISKAQKGGTLEKGTTRMSQIEKVEFWGFAATTFHKAIKELLIEGVQRKFN